MNLNGFTLPLHCPLKWLDTHESMSTTPTFITEALHLVIYISTAVLNDCYNEVTAYTVLTYSYWASVHDVYECLRHAH